MPGEKQQDLQGQLVQNTDAGKDRQGLATCFHKQDATSVFVRGAVLQSLAQALQSSRFESSSRLCLSHPAADCSLAACI